MAIPFPATAVLILVVAGHLARDLGATPFWHSTVLMFQVAAVFGWVLARREVRR